MVKILVIDDEPLVRTTIRQILTAKGHEIIEAENGQMGLEMMRKHRPVLVITDIIMPRKEGIETIIELRRENPGLRIIAISGGGRLNMKEFLKIAGKFGAAATIGKPFRMAELLKAVDVALKPGAG